ncbi:sulfite exporter TauE/SafE family protein [Pseudomonas sp. MPC6]|uniref:sulfite exporter TauE/SafE family protein n=1 Tax=unclassified Pseudomonas TaxID=196821 RepID=UPI0011103F39|nr:sulfite exporter TauE/SafE family protein [Pseudomonas sp. MPC6]QCY12479.1 sulfite exporter TauE/SafE family protein [Pseudomonas sp. MPC6]
MVISLILGILVGAILGLTGAGGGILAVPALVAGMGLSMQQAAPMALVAVAGSAVLGALEGLRKKLVRYRAAMLMAITGVPFTLVGLHVAQAIPQHWLMGLFGVIMLIVGVRLLLQNQGSTAMSIETKMRTMARLDPQTGRFQWCWGTGLLLGSIGALTGFLTGLLGVGGGFVIAPMLRRFTNVSMHGVVATSLMVIALVGTGGIMVALAHGAEMPIQATVLFAIATAMGMATGRQLVSRLSECYVQRGFAVVLIMVAIGLVTRAILASVFG